MKFIYLSNTRLPGEKAHAIQIMKTCAALAATSDVLLLYPRRRNRAWLRRVTNLVEFYDLPRDVPRKSIPCIDLFDWVLKMPVGQAWGYRFVFALQMWTYHLALLPYIWKDADVFYTRDSLTAGLLAALRPKIRKKVFFEAHTFPASRLGIALQGWFAHRIGGIITINHLLAKRYRQFGCSPESISVISDAVEASNFALISKAPARKQLGIPADRYIAMYVGQMYVWKGVDTLIAAAAHLSDEHCIWLVGGTPEELPRIRRALAELDNSLVVATGYIEHREVPTYLAAADVLVLPNSGQHEISRFYTSPLKMFEYMAAGRAIIASDLPSIREVLTDGENALLVPPDNPKALAETIKHLRANSAITNQIAERAKADSASHSWDGRAQQILKFVARHSNSITVTESSTV